MTLYDIADECYTQTEEIKSPLDIPSDWFKSIPEPEQSEIRLLARPKLSDFYPKDCSWVLRNLTTHEFVRSDAVALTPDHVQGPWVQCVGFGEVVLSRTCWSADSSTSMD